MHYWLAGLRQAVGANQYWQYGVRTLSFAWGLLHFVQRHPFLFYISVQVAVLRAASQPVRHDDRFGDFNFQRPSLNVSTETKWFDVMITMVMVTFFHICSYITLWSRTLPRKWSHQRLPRRLRT
jgi:hypothetical protein